MAITYILLGGGIHMVLNSQSKVVAKSDKAYAAVIEAVKKDATEDEVLAILDQDRRLLEDAIAVTPDVVMKGGQLFYQDEPIAGVLGQRMLEMTEQGFDLSPMVAFLRNLLENPSNRVVENLYAFLEAGGIPISPDGCFVTYKAVRHDFQDIHSESYSNKVGEKLSMSRHRVDENPDRTCSYGFHVCSFDYLPHFAHANGHVVLCKVNPKDVVAIPRDYNNTKMRVCAYEVVGEHEGYYDSEEGVSDILRNTAVATCGKPFEVEVDCGEGFEPSKATVRLSEAATFMEERLEDSDVRAVRIVNVLTGKVLDVRDNPRYESENSFETTILEEALSYSIVGFNSEGQEIFRDDHYDDPTDAARDALEYDDEECAVIRIVDSDGKVVKTIQ
jgi:hypothetical protein